ncbi:hypothetical protein FPANT_4013 [Fusarium pseudoanthophilum]|uniref:Uncharacterized protein n=1 Tax=Fusarium pseudoanthophilum TaxID=48495 RepID=A0A8H5PJJ9_9HYPO|nr:hypothetical protein FPANT_4013 [Fusarium pseudoanthophilum]
MGPPILGVSQWLRSMVKYVNFAARNHNTLRTAANTKASCQPCNAKEDNWRHQAKGKASPKGKKSKSKPKDDDTLEDIGKEKNRRIATKTILKGISRGDFPATGDTRGEESVGPPPRLS